MFLRLAALLLIVSIANKVGDAETVRDYETNPIQARSLGDYSLLDDVSTGRSFQHPRRFDDQNVYYIRVQPYYEPYRGGLKKLLEAGITERQNPFTMYPKENLNPEPELVRIGELSHPSLEIDRNEEGRVTGRTPSDLIRFQNGMEEEIIGSTRLCEPARNEDVYRVPTRPNQVNERPYYQMYPIYNPYEFPYGYQKLRNYRTNMAPTC